MWKNSDPFSIKTSGKGISDRDLAGFSLRHYEGSTIGQTEVGTLQKIVNQTIPITLGIIIISLFGVLALRLTYLQIWQGNRWRMVAEGNRIRLEIIKAQRGIIEDHNHSLLASNIGGFQLVAIPSELPSDENERQMLLNEILFDVPAELIDQESITRIAKRSYTPQIISYNLPNELAFKLITRSSRVRGFKVDVVSERIYPGGEPFAHLLGYVGKLSEIEYKKLQNNYLLYQLNDTIGKNGLELAYEATLRGIPGKRQIEVDAHGREQQVYASASATPGNTLTLTIDSKLQQIAYNSLKITGQQKPGSVVVLDPRNGEIRALVSYPSFDPNIFTILRDRKNIENLLKDNRQPLYNRAISGEYPPGSTIKPFLAAGALDAGVIVPQTTILSTGGIKIGRQTFADWKKGGHGLVDVTRAIAESVNTFFYAIGGGLRDQQGLGISRIISYLTRFGFGSNPSLGLDGEKTGFIPSPAWKQTTHGERWFLGDTYNVSIGQGNLLVTPLQLAIGYATLINGGYLIKPHLVTQKNHQTPEKIIISDDALQIVKQGMRKAVTDGSARRLGDLSILAAGKTGTAQSGTYTSPHAWFAGYAPFNNPEIVLVVMVERGGEGSGTAVSIAHDIITRYAIDRNQTNQLTN